MHNNRLKHVTFNTIALFYIPITAAVPALSQLSYTGAGVLPTYMKNNRLYAVIAREAYGKDKGTYDSFAGSRDANEQHPVVTAARESAEEMISHKTMNLSVRQMRDYIDVNQDHTTMLLAHQRFKYVLYVTRFDKYINRFFRNFYDASRSTKEFKYQEKDRIAVVAWSDLKTAILQNKNQIRADVFDPYTNRSSSHMIVLRPILIKSLRSLFRGDNYQTGKNKKIRFY